MSRVWTFSQRRDGELLVLLALADFSNDSGESWPSLDVLAQKARLTKTQVCKVLKKLEDARELRRERSTGGRNRRTRYFINLPPENSQEIILLKEQCKSDSVAKDNETVSPVIHALNRHISVIKRERVTGKPSPSSSDPRGKEFFAWWDGEYRTRFSAPYVFSGAKEGALVKRLLKKYDLLKLQDIASRFFASNDPWVQNNGGFTIGVFASQINKIISTTKASQARQPKEMPP